MMMKNRYVSLALLLVATACQFQQPRRSGFIRVERAPYDHFARSKVGDPDPDLMHSIEELDSFIAEWTEGWEPLGEPVTGSLERIEPWSFEREPGQCYLVVFRLDEEAELNRRAKAGLHLAIRAGGLTYRLDRFHGPGGVTELPCANVRGTAEFDAYARHHSSVNRRVAHEVGTGGFIAQLYTRAATDQELESAKAEATEQEEARKEKRVRRIELCARCASKHVECVQSGGTREECKFERSSCMTWQHCNMP